jgi:hypothetical protein
MSWKKEDNMKGAIRFLFALVAAILFALAAGTVLWGAFQTPMFEPNDAHSFLLDTVGAAIVAFIAALLGIAVAGDGETFGKRVQNAMGGARDSKSATWLLGIDAAVFLLAGIGFVLLWVKPDLLAVQPGAPALTEAPEYVATQAKAFVGITLAALAALAPSAS